jgi:cytochrome c peroxidase
VSRSISRLVVGIVLVLGASCGESPKPEDPTFGTLVIELGHEVSGEPLVLGRLTYTNTAGNRFAIDRLRYYVSDVVLHGAAGAEHTSGVHYCDLSADATQRITLPDVPSGQYERISFVFGLDDTRNLTGALPSTPENDAMEWPAALGGGYHYMLLEGRFEDATGSERTCRVQTGRLVSGGTSTSHYFEVTLPNSSVAIGTGTTHLLALMDVGGWFADPPYDFNDYGTDMAASAAAQQILEDNGPHVFAPLTQDPVTIEFPPAFPPMIVPADNPTTRQGVFLGRNLYHDPILSADSTLACAGCHRPEHSFADVTRFSVGIDGISGTRNANALVNPGFVTVSFWDGRARDLEAQALEPVQNPIEMNLPWSEVTERLAANARYRRLFLRAFGTVEITPDRVTKAIAQFERTLISANAKYDRWAAGEIQLTAAEERGHAMFFSEVGDCFHCHGQNLAFTDNLFHNVGVDAVIVDPGLGGRTGLPSDMGLFRTPTLRNVELTGPYMHDGRFATLHEVVQHYNSGGFRTPTVDPLIRVGVGLRLTDQQVDDLVAFLMVLTDTTYATNPAYQSPF